MNQKTVGVLSIGSLAIAVAVVIVIGVWAINEFSFDRFQKDIDKMYRLCQNLDMGGEKMSSGSTYAPVGRLAKDACPEIEAMCRVRLGSVSVKTEKEEDLGVEAMVADTNFFTFFTFPLKMGDALHCLDAPDKVVIDESAALRYFPGEDPMGKNLMVYGENLTVSGVIILIFVFFINKQVDFMIRKDLGFDKGNILYVNDCGGIIGNYESFRAELMRNPAIADVTAAISLPTDWTQGSTVKKEGEDQDLMMEYCRVKPNYFDLFGMDMVEGESFRDDGNNNVCVLNETAARTLGFANPVGERVKNASGDNLIIKGIVKDAQTKSLHQKVEPQIYLKFSEYTGCIFFKVQGDFQQVIGEIEQKWNEVNPGALFKYRFLDERYEELYQAEMKISRILTIAMGIVFLISVAGLFAMAYYATQRRLKEIGIRKVNGATIGGLLLMLNRDFFLWVGIAFSIACPAAYVLVVSWLESFSDRTPMSWWVFALTGVIIFVVTLATVSY